MTASKITTKTETLTPEKARRYLRTNIQNRTINDKYVTNLVADIKAGRFPHTPGPLTFTAGGDLIDGQHRCLAVIRGKKSIQVEVSRGWPARAQDYIDLNRTRTTSNTLEIRGFKNTSRLSAMTTYVMLYGSTRHSTKTPDYERQCLTKPAKTAYVISHHAEFDASIAISRAAGKVDTTGVVAAMHCLFARVDKEDADIFIHSLVTGEYLLVGSPILVLRDRLLKNKNDKVKMSLVYKMQTYIKCWNYWRAGRELRVLRGISTKSISTIQ